MARLQGVRAIHGFPKSSFDFTLQENGGKWLQNTLERTVGCQEGRSVSLGWGARAEVQAKTFSLGKSAMGKPKKTDTYPGIKVTHRL